MWSRKKEKKENMSETSLSWSEYMSWVLVTEGRHWQLDN